MDSLSSMTSMTNVSNFSTTVQYFTVLIVQKQRTYESLILPVLFYTVVNFTGTNANDALQPAEESRLFTVTPEGNFGATIEYKNASSYCFLKINYRLFVLHKMY